MGHQERRGPAVRALDGRDGFHHRGEGRAVVPMGACDFDGQRDGLTGGLYSDQQIPIAKRATRLPMGLLTALHGELLNVAIEGGLGLDLSTAGSCRSPFHFPPSLSRLRLGWFV